MARDWSSGELRRKTSVAWTTPGRSNGRTGEEIFDEVWNRFLKDDYAGQPTTLGTIFHDAKEAGWVEDAFAPVVTPLDALGAIQARFVLMNLDGKVWILDRAGLASRSHQGGANKLALSSRTDGALLIKRFVKAEFPQANAGDIYEAFISGPETICFDGVEFNPAGTSENQLNLWIGPTISAKAGDWALIRSFLLEIICDGEQASYDYLLRYLAHALQHPEEKPGVAIILLGGQGTGKGSLGRILRKIWSATYLHVHNIDNITGNFNGSLERAFIVFMDEALFAGNRRGTDALKSLVTEPIIQINEKHQPMRQTRSYHRFVIATNAAHLKHTDRDDRRDFALRLSERHKGDHEYWRALHQAISQGAVAAMVHDLLAMDLTGFNVRDKPATRELLQQKLQSLDPIERWWFDCLESGVIGDEWPMFISTNDAIEAVVASAGGKLYRRPNAMGLVQVIQQLCPSASKMQKQSQHTRQRGLSLPALEQARVEFEQYIGAPVRW